MKKCKILIPAREHFKVDGPLYLELTGQGLSMGFMLAIVSAGTVILQYAINQLGYLIIAGHTAARKLNSFCSLPLMPLAMATATFVSQNRGADQRDRILKVVRYAMILSVGWAVFITVIVAFAAPSLIALLSGSSESVVLENGARYIRWNTPFYSVLKFLWYFEMCYRDLVKGSATGFKHDRTGRKNCICSIVYPNLEIFWCNYL